MLIMHYCHLSSTLSTFFLPKHGGSQASSGCPLLGAYWWVANERPIKGKSIDPRGAWWQYHCNRNTIEKDIRCQASEERGWNNHLIYCSTFGFLYLSLTFLSTSLPLHINWVQVDQYQTILPNTAHELPLIHSLWWFMPAWFLPFLWAVMALLASCHQTKQIACIRKAVLFDF